MVNFNGIRPAAEAALNAARGAASWGYRTLLSPIIPDAIERRIGLLPGAESINERSRERRASLMGEVFESAMARVAPDGMELYHVFANLIKNPRESWEFENEFEFVTAVLGLMPDSIQRGVLSMTIVPGLRAIGQTAMADEALADPDEFINRMRRHEADFGAIYTALRNFGVVGTSTTSSTTSAPAAQATTR